MIEGDTALEEEISRDEQRIEEYGGDDPEEPPVKSPAPQSPLAKGPPPAFHEKHEHDPNMVRFGGPEDKENPQNWSRKYKWWVTIVCSLMTVNV